MSVLVDVLSWVSLVLGGALVVIGGVGMWRLQDIFARLHAASLIDSLGIGFLAFGMALQAGLTLVTLKLVFIVLLVGLTSPVATHALAQAALHAGIRPKTTSPMGNSEASESGAHG